MRERIFRRPSARDLLGRVMGGVPGKVNDQLLLRLMNNGVLHWVDGGFSDVVEAVEQLPENEFILLPSNFRVPIEDSNYGIKSLAHLAKIDSKYVLRDIADNAPEKLTRTFAEENKLWPAVLINRAMEHQDVETPPIGFYWMGVNGQVRSTTWLRAVTGAEMEVMKKVGDFEGGVVDKRAYGRNLRVRVNSRTGNETYSFTLSRLPIHARGDLVQHSDWMNLGHNSSDPDASYRGIEHDQREQPPILFSAPTIFAFYEAMGFVGKQPGGKQFRINPFPIPTDNTMIDFVDGLRLRTLILDDNGRVSATSLNKTEIDGIIGARTIMRGYRSCWHHWQKKDLSFLYRPD